MTIEHKNGMIIISDIKGNYWEMRKYIGYSEKVAKKLFKEEMRGI